MVKEGVCFYLEHSNTAQEQRPHVYMVIAESGPEVVGLFILNFVLGHGQGSAGRARPRGGRPDKNRHSG